MIKITKKRESREGLQPCWRLFADGKRTKLFIEKAQERPHWGMTQEYDLCHDQLGFLKEGSVNALMTMAQVCANPCEFHGDTADGRAA